MNKYAKLNIFLLDIQQDTKPNKGYTKDYSRKSFRGVGVYKKGVLFLQHNHL
jgi:hypothetical protein